MNQKTYKIIPPIGNIVVPKEEMTEKEVREFTLSIMQNDEANATWRDKIEKDPIESVIEWLIQNGYVIKLK